MTADAVLLMAYGSPDRIDQVEAYYTDIRRGNAPSPELLDELIERYEAIGGGSPLSRIVELQRAALEAELARARTGDVRVYAGMRHIEPRIGQVVEGMAADGVQRFVAIALAPQTSSNAAGYRRAVETALAAMGPGAPTPHDRRFLARPAPLHRGARDRHRARRSPASPIPPRSGSCSRPTACRPASWPKATYTRPSSRATAALVAGRLGLASHEFAFQSAGRTGEPWLGPDLRDEIRRLSSRGRRASSSSCPVGFVADHLEVLYDIDIEAQAVGRAKCGVRLERARSMNADPTFIAGLADVASAARPAADPAAKPRPCMRTRSIDRPPIRGHGRASRAVIPGVIRAAIPARSAPWVRFGRTGTSTRRAPMLVYWETTLSCGLACRHCRATAMPGPRPRTS